MKSLIVFGVVKATPFIKDTFSVIFLYWSFFLYLKNEEYDIIRVILLISYEK